MYNLPIYHQPRIYVLLPQSDLALSTAGRFDCAVRDRPLSARSRASTVRWAVSRRRPRRS